MCVMRDSFERWPWLIASHCYVSTYQRSNFLFLTFHILYQHLSHLFNFTAVPDILLEIEKDFCPSELREVGHCCKQWNKKMSIISKTCCSYQNLSERLHLQYSKYILNPYNAPFLHWHHLFSCFLLLCIVNRPSVPHWQHIASPTLTHPYTTSRRHRSSLIK